MKTVLPACPHTCTHCRTYESSVASVSPHLYTLSYIQKQNYQHVPTPVHTVTHTKAVLPVFLHTCTHCHTYKNSIISMSPHLYTLSHIRKQCFSTPVHTVIHTKIVLPACPHTCTHCHTYQSSVASVSPYLYTVIRTKTVL